jgi:hypothetical protein
MLRFCDGFCGAIDATFLLGLYWFTEGIDVGDKLRACRCYGVGCCAIWSLFEPRLCLLVSF